MPDEVSNRLITQSHGLVRLPTKLENTEDLCLGTNDHEGSAMHSNKTVIKNTFVGSIYVHVFGTKAYHSSFDYD